MAELDDIQRSMEVEETEEEGFEEDRFKREHYDTDSDSVSSGREGASYTQHSARVQSQQPPSPVEQAYINNNVSGIDNRIPAHEWTFEEQFKQVSPDVVPNLKLFDFLNQIKKEKQSVSGLGTVLRTVINNLLRTYKVTRLERILIIIVPNKFSFHGLIDLFIFAFYWTEFVFLVSHDFRIKHLSSSLLLDFNLSISNRSLI